MLRFMVKVHLYMQRSNLHISTKRLNIA